MKATLLIRAALPLILALAAGGAQADSPYLWPKAIDATGRDHVTVEAGFTESIFDGRVAMRSDAFHVTGPNGDVPITEVTYLRDIAVFEVSTPVDGAYRVSSGQRMGRTARMYQAANGRWWMVGESDEPMPEGAETVEVQSVTRADVYISRGPAADIPAATSQGLEVMPVTSPFDIVAGEDAVFRLTFNGQPMAGADITVFREAGKYDGRVVEADLKTDADGRFTVRPGAPGGYMTQIRYRTRAPQGAATPYRSYTHTLSFAAGVQ